MVSILALVVSWEYDEPAGKDIALGVRGFVVRRGRIVRRLFRMVNGVGRRRNCGGSDVTGREAVCGNPELERVRLVVGTLFGAICSRVTGWNLGGVLHGA